MLQANRINPPEGQLIPLIAPQFIDTFGMNRMMFSVPRTRFIERGYEKGDQFLIRLKAIDANGAEICEAQSSFTWNGEGS